jgi:hypothetical protein
MVEDHVNAASAIERYVMLASLLVVIFATVYGLDRGVYLGSTTNTAEGLVERNCRYLRLTGISELPADGGLADPWMPGTRLANAPDNLTCRLFAK